MPFAPRHGRGRSGSFRDELYGVVYRGNRLQRSLRHLRFGGLGLGRFEKHQSVGRVFLPETPRL